MVFIIALIAAVIQLIIGLIAIAVGLLWLALIFICEIIQIIIALFS